MLSSNNFLSKKEETKKADESSSEEESSDEESSEESSEEVSSEEEKKDAKKETKKEAAKVPEKAKEVQYVLQNADAWCAVFPQLYTSTHHYMYYRVLVFRVTYFHIRLSITIFITEC